MRICVFLNALSYGGTEKAASIWAIGLKKKGHCVSVLSIKDGCKKEIFNENGIETTIVGTDVDLIKRLLQITKPDVIHAHVPGYAHEGEVLGHALLQLPYKIPVVQTNVFGRLENKFEDTWTDFRLFVSWTSAVQAAQRALIPISMEFFNRSSVAVNPLEPENMPANEDIHQFRTKLGIKENHILFGRFSRPDFSKWTNLPIKGFLKAIKHNKNIRLLLCEPPEPIASELLNSNFKNYFKILPATTNNSMLTLMMASVDAVLHSSKIGESFGYGIAEPMNLARPAIANSVPWGDLAQIELIRPGECGFISSTPNQIKNAVLLIANDQPLRHSMGINAQKHIQKLAEPQESINRLENALNCAYHKKHNPIARADFEKAKDNTTYIKKFTFGTTVEEKTFLYSSFILHKLRQYRRTLRKRHCQ
ncbi:MAG: glycosyltransferase family 4 protein [Paludibacteraceae bacterium]|nr:glycosyltransferase family 4 protein [Paludibacteraceae bacterium]